MECTGSLSPFASCDENCAHDLCEPVSGNHSVIDQSRSAYPGGYGKERAGRGGFNGSSVAQSTNSM